jgi:molybdopterin-containing oxidoreductase family iron-sulfur binding subunit
MTREDEPGLRDCETPPGAGDAVSSSPATSAADAGAMSRRDAIRVLMGASSALALGLGGCERKPRRRIVSRAFGPEYQKPGKALYYASTWTEGPVPYGVTIKTVDGRPIKIEGNPDHPINRGTSSAAMQASILSLYDPDRLREPRQEGDPVSWEAVDERVIDALQRASSIVVMTRSTLGPAERAMVSRFLAAAPNARHLVHEAVHDGPRRSAWTGIYGAGGRPLPRFEEAKVILSLDSDFLGSDGATLENIRLFAEGRRLDDDVHADAEISRLYVVEGAVTVTGSSADHRIRLRPSALGPFVRAMLSAIKGDAGELGAWGRQHGVDGRLLNALVDDLRTHRGAALVVAGPHLPQAVHAGVALLNDALEAPGRTLVWSPVPPRLPVDDPAEVEAVFDNGVDVAILLDANPLFDWPGRDFGPLLAKAGLSVGHGLHRDETLAACTLALPSSHYLESWNDAEPRAGITSICQPVIAPLFRTRQPAESLLAWTQALSDEGDAIHNHEDWHDFLKEQWVGRLSSADRGDANADLPRSWEEALQEGGAFRDHGIRSLPTLDRRKAVALSGRDDAVDVGNFELVIQPHHALYDGRFANNGWLQELPEPASKLVWDTAAAISPKTAEQLGVREGDLVNVGVGDRSVVLPALIQPGTADGVVVTTLGHGRTTGGEVLKQAGGVNLARLLVRDTRSAQYISAAQLTRAGGSRRLVRTQKEFSRHDRPIVLDGTLGEYRRDAAFVKHKQHHPEPSSLYPPYDYSQGHKWVMAIDLGACVGCNACVTACQAENNIPIVGREQCALGREMHWIRLDRYLDGDRDDPVIHQQPMLCQQCDNAPCEAVCPVNATAHSPEGLNAMVYNRCVGTRYCSNNCPYKVRRFNFLRYQAAQLREPVQELMFNPQVTVRGVGVMEKCTFCVQRINEIKYRARNRDVPIKDGTIVTACQQACPAQAITFGDVNDPDSRIAKTRGSGRAFFVLEELNVKPNVAYLARVRNPNPAVTADVTEEHHG